VLVRVALVEGKHEDSFEGSQCSLVARRVVVDCLRTRQRERPPTGAERPLIAEPGGCVVVNPTGNSGLGKAGNGDTLTGLIVGFVAQAAALKIAIFETLVAAMYIAGLAGDIADEKYGKRIMTASDVRDSFHEAFTAVMDEQM